ncbi:MAG: outer membrane beta-barrel protein [Bacteroidota bacterium]|nr:outer membrane beta-barrel protein [Bacteroidota bacterium]
MANRDANIDLLFRNGLKDFEVLPPVGVWARILPVIRQRQKPYVMLRAAAVVAVIVSVSVLAYKWSTEINITLQDQNIAVSDRSVNLQGNRPIQKISGHRSAKSVTNSGKEIQTPPLPEESQITSPDNQADKGIGNTTLAFGNLPSLESILGIKRALIPGMMTDKENSGTAGDNNSSLKGITFDQPKDKTAKWSITALVSPTYYLRPELDNSNISKQISSSEQSRISYSGGVSFAYKISRKLSIQSGLYYSTIGNEINGISSFSGFRSYDYTKGDHNFEVLTSNGLIYTNNSDVFLMDRSGDRVLTKYTNDVFDPAKAQLSYVDNTLYQNFSYLEMPVFLRYKLIDRTIGFNVIGGLSYNLLVNNTVNAHISGNNYSVGKTAGLNPFMVTSSFGMGMEYNISDKISLNLEPTFRYYLNPFSMIQGPKTHPYSFGVFSGLSYKF